MKHIQTFESFLNEQESLDESTNRWYNTMIDLGRIGVQFKWVGELSFKTDGIKDAAKKHFPGVDLGDLAIVFKKETGSKWDKARNILGGVLGDDKTSGEFLIVNSKTA